MTMWAASSSRRLHSMTVLSTVMSLRLGLEFLEGAQIEVGDRQLGPQPGEVRRDKPILHSLTRLRP
jgi:hypothetical protein